MGLASSALDNEITASKLCSSHGNCDLLRDTFTSIVQPRLAPVVLMGGRCIRVAGAGEANNYSEAIFVLCLELQVFCVQKST